MNLKLLVVAALSVVVVSSVVSKTAQASELPLNDTFYRCGSAAMGNLKDYVELGHFQSPMSRVPMWVMSYGKKRVVFDPARPVTESTGCVITEVQQLSDGFLFKGSDCSAKVIQNGEKLTSIQFNDLPAIAECAWGSSDDTGKDFSQIDVMNALQKGKIPCSVSTK